jgi:tellurite resistance protein
MLDPHTALIYTMVLISASDRNMTDRELGTIGDVVCHLPIFRDFDKETLSATAQRCAEEIARADELDDILERIAESLPDELHETAYAFACDVVAADGRASQEELRLLEILRHRLDVGRLEAAAIERGARARFRAL